MFVSYALPVASILRGRFARAAIAPNNKIPGREYLFAISHPQSFSLSVVPATIIRHFCSDF